MLDLFAPFLNSTLRGLTVVAMMGAVVCAASGPVTFEFKPPSLPGVRNPYARELWAEVTTPSGRTLVLPAYYSGHDSFIVHARPDEIGGYRFGRVAESTAGRKREDLTVELLTLGLFENTHKLRLPAVGRDPDHPGGFRRADGHAFYPAGANLAWSNHGPPAAFYQQAIPAFARANLNWMRIWMAHWDGLNLDWLPADMGASPPPGGIDGRVAENWDHIIGAAQANGVYVQMVLQHHGQYSTTVNSNWADNPWNAANPGGFLTSPVEFFTSPDALLITRLKYRYIVARWGWSTAIMAWEFFNEVHWTDAMRQGHEADVARWHAVMADYVRSIDAYGHLLTTSTEDLSSPIYAKMDYYQPHLYAANLLAATRRFEAPAGGLDRPVFYGEVGDDHQLVSAAVKDAGLTLLPPVWASVMGEGSFPAMPWEGWKLLDQHRLGELGAVVRLVVLNHLPRHADLKPFSPVVECARQVPLTVPASQAWQRRRHPLDLTLPTDGREAIDLAEVPGILAAPPKEPGPAFPDHVTYHLVFPHPAVVKVTAGAVGEPGADLQVTVDGRLVAEKAWSQGRNPEAGTDELTFAVEGGEHVLVLANTKGPGWVAVPSIDLGLPVSAIAAVGRRNDRLVALWLWRRDQLYALEPGPAAAGKVRLDALPAGAWEVTWWNTTQGAPAGPAVQVHHPGGQLLLDTPPITRQTAVILRRLND